MSGPTKPRLGVATEYPRHYSPELLVAIPRAEGRGGQALEQPLYGVDIWTAYELSWLEPSGKPRVAIAEMVVPADSRHIVESKSLKLYLNSLNREVFADTNQLAATLERDLSRAFGGKVRVTLYTLAEYGEKGIGVPEGESLDELAVSCDRYTPDPQLLAVADESPVSERLYTDLFKTNCPVTGQPDWATVLIDYRGPAMDRTGLLRYLVSFRDHQDFHENCVERLFADILARCRPASLTVSARYTRRGGLDINPWRSTEPDAAPRWRRLARQ
jgi:7-cyano-7-deazaguanine reductase